MRPLLAVAVGARLKRWISNGTVTDAAWKNLLSVGAAMRMQERSVRTARQAQRPRPAGPLRRRRFASRWTAILAPQPAPGRCPAAPLPRSNGDNGNLNYDTVRPGGRHYHDQQWTDLRDGTDERRGVRVLGSI